MVHVHPVTDAPQPHQRLHREGRAQHPRSLQTEDQGRRGEAEHTQPPGVRRPASCRPLDSRPQHHSQPADPQRTEPAGSALPHHATGGERRATEDLTDPCRCRPVRLVGPPVHGDDSSGDDPRRGQRREGQEEPHAPLRDAPQQHERERPDPVELLLHRQRPVVLDRAGHAGRPTQQIRVRPRAVQRVPVGHLHRRADDVAPQVRHAGELAAPRQQRNRHQAQQACRQQPLRSPYHEGRPRHAAGALVLEDEQRRDEEARQREEHRHAHVAARHPGEAAVEAQHQGHRHATHTIQRRLVPELLVAGHRRLMHRTQHGDAR